MSFIDDHEEREKQIENREWLIYEMRKELKDLALELDSRTNEYYRMATGKCKIVKDWDISIRDLQEIHSKGGKWC